MKKVNWWIDPLMLPVVGVAFLVGYIWMSWQAGFALAEWTFDPDAFMKRCTGIAPKKAGDNHE